MFNSTKRKNQHLLLNYDKPKDEDFDFDRISMYFSCSDKSKCHQVISDATWKDLDFDEIFMYMDRTVSKVGQQYLYNTLRSIPKDDNSSTGFESIIQYLDENSEIKKTILLELNSLRERSAYFLKSLFSDQLKKKPKWFFVIPLLSFFSGLALIISIKFPALLLALLPLLVINTILHFWNKNNVMQYSNSIPQLLILNKVAKKIMRLKIPNGNLANLKGTTDSLDRIGRKAFIFKMEAMGESDLAALLYFIVETVKVLFLVEPLFLFRILEELEKKRADVLTAYCAVGEVDTAISIDSFRKELPFYAKPTINQQKKSISGKNIYHPLLVSPVANTINICNEKSVLISGSNMSGKTTFIRTIGVNLILAQTVNTVLANEFAVSKTRIHSAIRIADNLMDDKSYYLEEVLVIKEMIKESESGHQNLFLLDELFKGTNTRERISIGKAVLSYLNRGSNLVFASSHDLELNDYLSTSYNLYHFNEEIQEGQLVFDYTLKEGRLTRTNAINILELHHYPTEIVQEARLLFSETIMEKSGTTAGENQMVP